MHRKLDTSDALRAPAMPSQVPHQPTFKSRQLSSPNIANWKQLLNHATPFLRELLLLRQNGAGQNPTQVTNGPSRCNSSGVNPPRSLEADSTPPMQDGARNYSLLHVPNFPPHMVRWAAKADCKVKVLSNVSHTRCCLLSPVILHSSTVHIFD